MKENQHNLIIHTKQNLNELEADWFEERAAILEFEAGFNRQEAERKAWQELQFFRGKKIISKAG